MSSSSQPAREQRGEHAVAVPTPNVRFSGQVMKIGFDGTSLPRLVVVTDETLYVCLVSGGITRSIDMSKVEYLSISTTGDGEAADDGDDSTPQSRLSSSSTKRDGSTSSATGGSGGGATPEKIADRIRRRFQRKKNKESAIKARKGGAQMTSSAGRGGAGADDDDVSMIIATVGVQGEVALVLRFHTDDDAVAFADAVEMIAEESQTPIRFHLPSAISSRTSRRTSPARMDTVSPPRVAQALVETSPDSPPAKETTEDAAPSPVPDTPAVEPTPAPAAPTVDPRLTRWRERQDATTTTTTTPNAEASALPPRSYFSAATFGTRPSSSHDGDAPAAEDPIRDPTPSPDSTRTASLPSSSNSTSAPPSPVPARRRASSTVATVDDAVAQHEAVVRAALAAARRSEDARRHEPDVTILEPLVRSTKSSVKSHTSDGGDGAAQSVEAGPNGSAAYELELSPDAHKPQAAQAAHTDDVADDNEEEEDSDHEAEEVVDPNESLYQHLYGDPPLRRHPSLERSGSAAVTHEHAAPSDKQEAVPATVTTSAPPLPPPQPPTRLSGLNESHLHQPQEQQPSERRRNTSTTEPRISRAVPIAFRESASTDVSRLLRIDEGLAEEMLAAREEARVAQAARREVEHLLDDRDAALGDARDALKLQQDQHEKALAKQARAHRAELREVQEAFDAYETRIHAFLDKLQGEHEADAAQWLAERRELKAMLAARDAEVDQLTQLLSAAAASAVSPPSPPSPPPPPPPPPPAPAVAPSQDPPAKSKSKADPATSTRARGTASLRRGPQPQSSPPPSVPARFSATAYLDAGRGRAGIEELPSTAGSYDEAQERLQSKLAKYTQRPRETRAVAAAAAVPAGTVHGRSGADVYDLDEAFDDDLVMPLQPARVLKTPIMSRHAQSGRHGASRVSPPAAQRATTRLLQYPEDDEEAPREVRAPPPPRLAESQTVTAQRRGRQAARLMSPSRE